MNNITSTKNEKIKEILKLKQKKYRDETNLVLIEGYKIYLEALKVNCNIKEIFLTSFMQEKLNIKGNNVIIISEEVSSKLTYNITSQDFFAVIEKPVQKIDSGSFLILDNIQDPQNLGAIIRTSVATNVKNLYLINCVDIFNDKVVRASMGNVFKINYQNIEVKDLEKICKNCVIYCADMDGENIFNMKKSNLKFGLVLGNEGNGVSEMVKNFATKTLSIPMQNNVESLNVAVSSGIILYFLTN